MGTDMEDVYGYTNTNTDRGYKILYHLYILYQTQITNRWWWLGLGLGLGLDLGWSRI